MEGSSASAAKEKLTVVAFVRRKLVKQVSRQPIAGGVVAKGVALRVKPGQSPSRADPERSIIVREHGKDGVTGKAIFFRVVIKCFCPAVQAIEAAAPCPHPQVAGLVLIDGRDRIIAQAVGVIRVVLVASKPL